jgi:hypothetical protein
VYWKVIPAYVYLVLLAGTHGIIMCGCCKSMLSRKSPEFQEEHITFNVRAEESAKQEASRCRW